MPERSSRGAWWLLLFFAVLIVGAAGGVLWFWWRLDEVDIGLHGYLALALGIGATIALWVGLMRLAYRSHRSGRDDEAGR